MNLTVWKETDITEVRRIGKEREGFRRPILMKVRTTNMKMEILRKRINQKELKYTSTRTTPRKYKTKERIW